MARPTSHTLTEREAQIMDAIWNAPDPQTAEEIRATLPDKPHDSSVRTLLRVLETKGCVVRETEGRAHRYRAAVPRAAVQRNAVRSLLQRFFQGSSDALLMRLVEDEEITPEQLDELKRNLRARKKGKRQ
jgi:predicted transcriptional regulator